MVFGPVESFTKENVKARWTERYTSDAVNKKFLGLPRGIYLGFVPSQSGLVLTLKTDTVITLSSTTGSFAIGDAITGGTSGATASARVISPGYLLIDNVVGTFQVGETITGGAGTAVVGDFRAEGISFGRVVSANALSPGRSEDMLDVLTTDDVALDFTGFPDGVYHVILTANYQVGQATSAQILTRTTPSANGASEVLICQATKIGPSITIDATAPLTRHEPFAFTGTRIGFMPGGSIEALLAATATTNEVIAARRGSDGVTAAPFNTGSPQTTGLPGRLNADLSNVALGGRLGKHIVLVQGNDLTLAAPATSANVSGSFAARNRDFEPYRDRSPATGIGLPAGVPTAIPAGGSEFVSITLTGVSGVFTTGLLVTGATSGATAIVKSVAGSVVSVGDLVGSLFVGEVIDQSSPSASGTISDIDLKEGALTEISGAVATLPNIVQIIDADTGNKPLDVNAIVYGRLVYGPGGSSNPGEHVLAGGQQLNFTAGATTVIVAAGSITTPDEITVGDIIEGDDSRFYEVASIAGSPITSFTLPVTKPYVGPTAINVGGRRRRRFILEFKKIVAGIETAATLPTGTYRIFFPTWFTLEKSNPDATNKVAAAGGQQVGIRVQNNGAVAGLPVGSGSISGAEPIVNIVAGSNIAIAMAEDATTGKLHITITNSAPSAGTPFPGFDSAILADTAGGSGGVSTLAARADHRHDLSSEYGARFAERTLPPTANADTFAPGFAPRLLVSHIVSGPLINFGIAFGVSNRQWHTDNAGIPSLVGSIANDTGPATIWSVTSFTSSDISIAAISGVGNWDTGYYIVLG